MHMLTHDMDLEIFLKKVPLFSSIPNAQIRKITACFESVFFEKDAVIFEQGEISHSMYIIRAGAVMVGSTIPGNVFQTELQRGDFFGEMALLSDMPRNATVTATLDTTVFQLSKTDFDTVLAQNKHIGLFLSRLYARRLSSGIGRDGPRKKPMFYSVAATEAGLGLSHFLYSVSYHIHTESQKKVLVVEPHLEPAQVMEKYGLHSFACPDDGLFDLLPANLYQAKDFRWFHHPSGFEVLQVRKGFRPGLVSILSLLMEKLKTRYSLVFFNLGHYFESLEQEAVRLCDKNLLLINNTRDGFSSVKEKVIRLEKQAGKGFDRVRVGVSHLCGTHGIAREELQKTLNLSETPQIWVDRTDVALKDRIDTEKRFPIKGARAVAREIAGIRVGLALGAGAARGWAHIGVLKALQDNGIHIDMIAGTSMGALVAAIFAARASVQQLKQETIDRFPTRWKARREIFDYTFPFKGLLKGKKAMRLVANAVDHADFMDLLIPAYIVGVDIYKGEEVLFETGDVARAVRSSFSLPAVFAPTFYRGRWMVDGGLLNPVPVNVLEQKGADKIIAVCAENPRNSSQKKFSRRRAPGILDVIARTMKIVHQRATDGFAQKSDIVIYPEVDEFAWDDFHKGEALMQKGIDACQAVMKDIKSLIP